ncbi:MAG: hypothetical protein AMJ78_04545 [Omnitrophica WOR_2 bacterium SM23_29]|nr:MAG: hypothetical protein AMJ78_04545 [Omnitrophica WOR_2 bacterium SM23_29]
MAIFNGKITTSVEISDKYIKLVQIFSKGTETKVIACVFKELSASEPTAAVAALQEILSQYNIKPKSLILTIPRQSVTVKSVKIPSRDPQEIYEMIGFQAVKQIPYPKEEISYGFNVTDVDSEGYSKVMLIICHRDAILRPIEILKNCGLSPAKVTLSSFGLLNWFNLRGDLSTRSEASPIILVDCDTYNSDIAIVRKGKLIYTRGLTFGSAEGAHYYEKLADEIGKTLPIYEKETQEGRPLEAIFTGNTSELAHSKSELERSLNAKVEFMGSFERVPLSIATPFQPYVAQASYSSLLGTAIGPEEVDLLPKALKLTSQIRIKKRELTISAILILTVITSASFVIWNKIYQKEQELEILDSKLKDTAPLASEIEKMRSTSEVIKSQLTKKTEALDVLNELYKIVPPQIYLALYTYDGEKVELKGTASVLSDVFRLVTILENSPYFQNIEVRYATKRKIGSQELIDFEINCPLSKRARGGK